MNGGALEVPFISIISIKVTLSYNNGLFAIPESESYWLMQSFLFNCDVFFRNNYKREENRIPVPLPL